MTATERNKRGEKSAVIVARLLHSQLRAMGCERFDIGIKRDAGDMILSEGQGASRSSKPSSGSATRTPKEPTSTSDPLAVTVLSLIDDLTIQAIERMKAEGFEPAIIVETSPNNFHAWVNHGRVLETATSTLAAKQLAERFGGARRMRTGDISDGSRDYQSET